MNASPAVWASDPFGRHEHRYFDGKKWTNHVADAGVGGRDAAEHHPPQGASAQGRWSPDPFGRRPFRYHDGRRWTNHVADEAGMSIDEPIYPGPAAEAHPNESKSRDDFQTPETAAESVALNETPISWAPPAAPSPPAEAMRVPDVDEALPSPTCLGQSPTGEPAETITVLRTALFARTGGFVTPSDFDTDIRFATGRSTEGCIQTEEPPLIRLIGVLHFVCEVPAHCFKGVGEMLVTPTRVLLFVENLTVGGKRTGKGTCAAAASSVAGLREVQTRLDRKGSETIIGLNLADGAAGFILAPPIRRFDSGRLSEIKDVGALALEIVTLATATEGRASWSNTGTMRIATITR